MSCECGGTGWLTYTGDYRTSVNGPVFKEVEQVRRCGRYVRYFNESELMQKYADKCPVPVGGDHCPAAVQAHKAIIDAALNSEKGKWKS